MELPRNYPFYEIIVTINYCPSNYGTIDPETKHQNKFLFDFVFESQPRLSPWALVAGWSHTEKYLRNLIKSNRNQIAFRNYCI